MDDVLKLFGVMVAIMSAGGVGYFIIAVANTVVRRLNARTPVETQQLEAEMADIRARLDDADAARGRIAELEERLDFTERMLAQHREAPRVGPGER